MLKHEQLEEIHKSLVNGQRKQMVGQIDEYSLYDFWDDYGRYLCDLCIEESAAFEYYRDAVVSYHRIKNR